MNRCNCRWIALAALLLFLLAGCAQQGLPEGTSAPGETSAPSADAGTVSQGLTPADISPSRDLYISCEDMTLDLDIFQNYTVDFGFRFHILSHEAVDTSTLQVDIPVEASYGVTVTAMDVLRKTEYAAQQEGLLEQGESSNDYFPYWLYMAYCGKDFGKLAQLYQQYSDDYGYGHFLYEEMNDFKALTKEDIPRFYAYEVKVEFWWDSHETEAFQTIEVTLEGQTYRFDIGEVRLVSAAPVEALPISTGIYNNHPQYVGSMILPYSTTARESDMSAFDFTAPEDMTLTGISFYRDRATASDILVRLTGEAGEVQELTWDGSSPLAIAAGDRVQIWYTVTLAKEIPFLDYTEAAVAQLSFESPAETACLLHCYTFYNRELNPHVLYAHGFLDVDIESCYRDFFVPSGLRYVW